MSRAVFFRPDQCPHSLERNQARGVSSGVVRGVARRDLSLSLSLFHTVSSTVEGLLSVVSSDSVHDPSVGSHVLPRCLMVRSSCDGILGAWWSLSIAPDIAGHGHFPVEASSGGLHSCRGKPCLSKERADEVKDQVLGLGTCRVRNAEK